ncbi:ferredoxin [Actinocorallia herbida]|uniref:Ferredoxin n=1 Tax=Actinocorallia herbida TaxID=58109 RepID=A0A3N1D3A9_9ACTN|nr:ferredoxin [Actinocorallia herbida]ROO87990.1 ferredoxin [Actinocorallia herbida]
MRLEIDPALCQGHARCAAVAPELFELDDDGYIAGRGREFDPALEEAARKGARACPEKVITVFE